MKDIILIKFLEKISSIRKDLDNLRVTLSRLEFFQDVQISFGIYTRGEPSQSELSLGIDSSLLLPVNNDLHSAGMSFRIYKNDSKWNFSGEVGWSSYNCGFEEINSIEKSYDDIEMLISNLESDFYSLRVNYESLISKYQSTL